MSFNNSSGNGFGPFDGNQPQPFWQMLMLVAIPAFVGACLPPVISHYLEKSKGAPPQPIEAPPPPPSKAPRKNKKETPSP